MEIIFTKLTSNIVNTTKRNQSTPPPARIHCMYLVCLQFTGRYHNTENYEVTSTWQKRSTEQGKGKMFRSHILKRLAMIQLELLSL